MSKNSQGEYDDAKSDHSADWSGASHSIVRAGYDLRRA
jgi:hypothetical protein